MASASKKKRLQLMEKQDELGLSRKKWRFTMSPKTFVILKVILIALIPILYFVYSPLLIFVMLAYVSLFFLSIMAEHSMNKSVIKSNHIHFAKFDSAIALIIIIIALAGTISSGFKQNKASNFGNFERTEISQMIGDKGFKGAKSFARKSQFKTYLINLGSLLTGERNIFKSDDKMPEFNFGTMKPPTDFPTIPDDVEMPKFDGNGKDFRPRPMEIMKNIPISYVSNSMLSSVSSVLIFSVSIFGSISLIAVYLKKRKIDMDMNEVIVEGKIEMLSDKELTRILSFGEDVEAQDNSEELEKKIELEHIETLKEEENFEYVESSNDTSESEDIEILNDDYILK